MGYDYDGPFDEYGTNICLLFSLRLLVIKVCELPKMCDSSSDFLDN